MAITREKQQTEVITPIVSSATVTWKPSLGTDTDSAFAAFADAHAAIVAANATVKTLVVEDFSATVPMGTWDMSNINVTGSRQNSSNYSVVFASGAEWENPLTISNLTFSNTGATAAWIVYDQDLEVTFTNVLISGRVAAAPLIEIDGACSVFLTLRDSTLSNLGGAAINYGFALFVKAFGASNIGANAIDIEGSGPISFSSLDQSVRVTEPQLNGDLLFETKFINHRNRIDTTGAGTTFVGTGAVGTLIVDNTAAALEILRFNVTEVPGTSCNVHLLASAAGNVDVQDSAAALLDTLTPGDTAVMVWDTTNWIVLGKI